jgi:hypothetical protein
MAGLDAAQGPDIVILDDLQSLYGPVRFNHRVHAKMTGFGGGCETCHHYTPPNAPHPECKSCHPREVAIEDLAQPGLKGAYHRNCMKCHKEWDSDTACEVCHEKKEPGQPAPPIHMASHYQPVQLDSLIIFKTGHDGGDEVPFHHRNHSELYERDCSECHRQQSCKQCHVQGGERHPMGDPAQTDLHDTCFQCHGEQACDSCHGRAPDDLFTHASTGWPLKSYHAKLRCRNCHGQRGAFMKLEPRCVNCHQGGWDPATFKHAVTGVPLDETHSEADCSDCHDAGPGSPANCSNCHDDGRRYDRKTGFGS